jgi:hypothetical protein
MFFFLLLYGLSHSYNYDPKYTNAVNNATEASYKQSGAEADFLKAKDVAQNSGNKWIRDNHLTSIAATGAAVFPVLMYKKVRVKERNIVIEGSKNSIQATWTLRW